LLKRSPAEAGSRKSQGTAAYHQLKLVANEQSPAKAGSRSNLNPKSKIQNPKSAMPLGAMLTSTLLIGQKSMTQQPTSEWSPAFDYSSATPIACRLYDQAARPNTNAFGQTLDIDAVALVSAGVSLNPLALGATDGERQQVQIDGVLYEVLAVRDLGHVGRVKEIELKRWA
jgi:hypothetical protein